MRYVETAKKKVEARQNRKTESRNGSKSTIRYHLEHGHDLYSSSSQIDTWRLTHWEEKNGWISKDAAAAYHVSHHPAAQKQFFLSQQPNKSPG
ncbi:hypothetical protein R6Q57_003806 [Mikania cordata]